MIANLVRHFVGRKPPQEFSHQELVALFAAMKEANIEAVPVDRFAKLLSRPAIMMGNRRRAVGLLRFDIHGNIERPLKVAQDLHALDMHGLFLMMHRHTVNESIYARDATWDSLKMMADMGHEIGLHFDPFYLIRAHGDLYAGIGAAVDELTGRGITIRAASVHGDTRPHIKECGLQANDFFMEEFRTTRWNGRPPKGEEFLAKHVRRYSQTKIANDHGIRYFAEPNFSDSGGLVSEKMPAYLSDNHRRLRINNLPGGNSNGGFLDAPERFRIPPEFAHEVVAALRTRPFIALFHPQWYA